MQTPEGRKFDRWTSRRHRERQQGVTSEVPRDYEDLIFEVFGRCCVACGSTSSIELDHHWPLRSGRSLLHNAVPLCRSCNRRKGNKNPRTFYDAWKSARILIALHEVRDLYEQRLGADLVAAPEVA